MKKQYAAAILAAVMTVGNIVPSFAGQWQWQDVNGDGISECYYYDDNGIMPYKHNHTRRIHRGFKWSVGSEWCCADTDFRHRF